MLEFFPPLYSAWLVFAWPGSLEALAFVSHADQNHPRALKPLIQIYKRS